MAVTAPSLDIYTCHTCRRFTVTAKVAEGDIPDEMPCTTPKCEGVMLRGKCIVGLDPAMLPAFEWYMPERGLHALSEENKDLIRRGMLLRRGYTGGSRNPG